MTVLALLWYLPSVLLQRHSRNTTTYDLSDPSYVNVTSIIYDVERDDQIHILRMTVERRNRMPKPAIPTLFISTRSSLRMEDFVK